MLRKNMLIVSCAAAAALTACGDYRFVHKPHYEVDPILQPYITLFEQKAFEQQVNIEIRDLRAYFVSDLGEDEDSVTLALCRKYETDDGEVLGSPEIEVDENEFRELEDSEKEALMFHELGHCILNRDHRDDRIPQEQNRQSSIMSTYLINAFYYVKYYNSYMYELFNGR